MPKESLINQFYTALGKVYAIDVGKRLSQICLYRTQNQHFEVDDWTVGKC